MAKETTQQLDLDSFINNLSKDTNSKSAKDFERWNLGFSDTKGNYFYLLIPSKNGYYKQLNKVKELKAFSTKLSKDTWFEILDKSEYGQLTEDEAKLYDEVVRLFAQVERIDANIEDWKAKRTRQKSYCLIFSHVIKFINHDSGTVDKEKVNKPAMLIFPSKKYLEAFNQAISTKNTLMGNNKWLLKVLSNDPKNREAMITTDFFGGQGGYKCQVSFEMDKDVVKGMLPENYDFTNEIEMFSKIDITKEFLKWQASEEDDKVFNSEVFQEIRLRLIDIINPATEKPLATQASTTDSKVAAANSMDQLTQSSDDDLPF